MTGQMEIDRYSLERKLQKARSNFKDVLEALTINLNKLRTEHLAVKNFVETELKVLGLKETISSILQRNDRSNNVAKALQSSQQL